MARCDYKIHPYPGIALAEECSEDMRVWQWRGMTQRICSNCFAAEMGKRANLIAQGPGRGYTMAESDAKNYEGGQIVGVWKMDTGYHPLLGPEPVFTWEALGK